MSCMMKPTKWTVCEICDYRSFEISQKLIFCAGLFLVGGGSIFYGWIFTLYRHDLHVDPLGAGWALWSRRHLRFLTPSRSAQTFPANGAQFLAAPGAPSPLVLSRKRHSRALCPQSCRRGRTDWPELRPSQTYLVGRNLK